MMPRVKRLTADDTALLREAAALEALCIHEPWSYASFAAEAEKENGYVLAALDENDRLIGLLTACAVMDTADLTNVAVHPAARRCGIAGMLIRTLLHELKDTSIFLEVRASNEAAIALYRKYGFIPVGMRKRFYRNPAEDAILMQYGGKLC
jgi:ribosomal-protein-alanine N-acetyltransferase